MSLLFLGMDSWASGSAGFGKGNNHKIKCICAYGGGKDQKFSLAEIEFEMLRRHPT
jgi:hypothetical protein